MQIHLQLSLFNRERYLQLMLVQNFAECWLNRFQMQDATNSSAFRAMIYK